MKMRFGVKCQNIETEAIPWSERHDLLMVEISESGVTGAVVAVTVGSRDLNEGNGIGGRRGGCSCRGALPKSAKVLIVVLKGKDLLVLHRVMHWYPAWKGNKI
jgi:hypothetical protein